MTAQARIKCSIWRDQEFRTLTFAAQWVYERLLSDSGRNHAGVLALTRRRWASSAAGMTPAILDAALDELASASFVVLDEDTEEVLIRTYIRHNDVAAQPNVLKSALAHATRVESPTLRAALAEELRKLPPKPADTARMAYPDPHAVADEIDPGPLAPRLTVVPARSDVSPGSSIASKGSENPSGNPSAKGAEKEKEKEKVVSRGGAGGDRPDAEALCVRLWERLDENDYKPLPAITKAWRDDARRLIDLDERNLDQALRLIDWCQQDGFWSTNIASMSKFRKQYPKLLAAARREHAAQNRPAPPSARAQRLASAAALVDKYRREDEVRAGEELTTYPRRAIQA